MGVSGGARGCKGVRGVLGAGRDSQYSGARKGIGHQGHWGLLEGRVVMGC